MGSTHSRPGLHKVGPCNILQEKTQKPKPQWTVPVLPHAVELPPGSVGEKRTTFPPLKQEITLSLLSGQGPHRWGCPPVFYNRPRKHEQSNSECLALNPASTLPSPTNHQLQQKLMGQVSGGSESCLSSSPPNCQAAEKT